MVEYWTNDREGKYFPDRYIVDVCTDDGEYLTEYFTDMSALFDWLGKIAERPVNSMQDVYSLVEAWKKENTEAFCSINEYQITD